MEKKIDEDYVKSGIADIDEGDLDLATKNSEEISKKITNSGVLKKYTELGKIMLGMLKDYKNGIYKNVPWFTMAAIGFSLLYVFNPFDIMPDFIPGIGYLDDFAVFTYSLKFIESDLHKYLDWKIAQTEE